MAIKELTGSKKFCEKHTKMRDKNRQNGRMKKCTCRFIIKT
jgi:hypothetical protein